MQVTGLSGAQGSRAFEHWQVAVHDSAFGDERLALSQSRPSQHASMRDELLGLLRCGGAQLHDTDEEGEPREAVPAELTHGMCAHEAVQRLHRPTAAGPQFTWSAIDFLSTYLLGTPMQNQSVREYVNETVDSPVLDGSAPAGRSGSSREAAAASRPPSPTSNKKRRSTRSGAAEPAPEVPAKRRSKRCAEPGA